MLFKLINTIAGYENRFCETTRTRLDYWRPILTEGGPPLPPIGDEIPGLVIAQRHHQIRRLLTQLMRIERRVVSDNVRERITYVGTTLWHNYTSSFHSVLTILIVPNRCRI